MTQHSAAMLQAFATRYVANLPEGMRRQFCDDLEALIRAMVTDATEHIVGGGDTRQ